MKEKRPGGWDYIIILVVFAITGSTAAVVARFLMPLTGIERGWSFSYVLVYILLITPIYQVLLLGYAWIFGKYRYFWEKQKKIGRLIAGLFQSSPSSSDSDKPSS